MTLQPITKVSKAYNVSTRTLRYYEQIGLIRSSRLPDYAYRAYDEEALSRLRQVLILRKLRIPLKQIGKMLDTRDARAAIDVLEQSIAEIAAEREALETIDSVLRRFVRELGKLLPAPLPERVFDRSDIAELVQALSMKTLSQKEETSMEDLNRANEILEQPRDVRIIYVPPMTVAACQMTGDNKEEIVGAAITAFIRASNLPAIKPDFRRIGFNNPASDQPGGSLGYEAWVSIPGELDVPAPLVKKRFLGGLYAAHVIAFGEFQEWGRLWQWVMNNAQYEVDFAPRTDPPDAKADPSLEEQLDAIHHMDDSGPFGTQLDLLVPIKPRPEKE